MTATAAAAAVAKAWRMLRCATNTINYSLQTLWHATRCTWYTSELLLRLAVAKCTSGTGGLMAAERGRRALRHWLLCMGPLFVKLGQMASVRPDLVGADVALALKPLRCDVVASCGTPDEEDDDRREIGRLVRRLWFQHNVQLVFGDSRCRPEATGSIANVYRGRLALDIDDDNGGGDKNTTRRRCQQQQQQPKLMPWRCRRFVNVAVKVLRPCVIRQMEFDLDLLHWVAGSWPARRWWPCATSVVAELTRLVVPQLDLRIEAANAAALRRTSGTRVPRTFGAAAAAGGESDLLITQWIDSDTTSSERQQRQQQRSELLVQTVARMLHGQCVHMDLHPGNVLWPLSPPSSSLLQQQQQRPPVVIDSGLVFCMPDDIADVWRLSMRYMCERRYRRLAELVFDHQPDRLLLQPNNPLTDDNNIGGGGHFTDDERRRREAWCDAVEDAMTTGGGGGGTTPLSQLSQLIFRTPQFGIQVEPRMTGLCMALAIAEGHYYELLPTPPPHQQQQQQQPLCFLQQLWHCMQSADKLLIGSHNMDSDDDDDDDDDDDSSSSSS